MSKGFANPQLAKDLFETETKFSFSQASIKNCYSGKYMTNQPFNDDLKVWETFNNVWKVNYSQSIVLNSILAKSLIHSCRNYQEIITKNRQPRTQVIDTVNFEDTSKRNFIGEQRLLKSLDIIIANLNDNDSELKISFENVKLNSKVSLVTIRRFWRIYDIPFQLQRLLEYWVWEEIEIPVITKFMEYINLLTKDQ